MIRGDSVYKSSKRWLSWALDMETMVRGIGRSSSSNRTDGSSSYSISSSVRSGSGTISSRLRLAVVSLSTATNSATTSTSNEVRNYCPATVARDMHGTS